MPLLGSDSALRILLAVGEAAQAWVIGRIEHTGAFGRNGQRYESYVQSRERQAWMHRGRWMTLEDEAALMEPVAREMASDALRQIAAGQGADVLRTAMLMVLEDGVEQLQRYPGERPGQRYQRTGELMVGWRVVEGAG